MERPKTRVLAKSNAHFQKAVKRLPLGVASTFRYWGDERTIYVHHGKGGRTWDIDGNCYVDYRLGYGPAILGYADDRVDEAARKGMEVGGVFALSTERELSGRRSHGQDGAGRRTGALLQHRHRSGHGGSAPRPRLYRQGQLHPDRRRLSRPLRCRHVDGRIWISGIRAAARSANGPLFRAAFRRRSKDLVYLTPMNDANRLEDIFKKHSDHIGAMLIEPMMGNCCAISATTEFVKHARELCDKYGVLLIIDEVKTGFRVAKGGVQSLHGVKPDITTFAKAMANGYPIAAVAGREEIMRTFSYGGAAHGGTYTAHSVSLAAAEKCLEILDETPALETLATYGETLKAGIKKILDRARHRPFLLGPLLDVRPVLRAEAAEQLPRLEALRLYFLRHAWPITCTISASSASPIRASPGSCAKRMTRAALTIHCGRSSPRSI